MKTTDKSTRGQLKIFFGYAAGVGKTFTMLTEAREQLDKGVDVMVGYIEPHSRPETLRRMEGLPALAPKMFDYRNITIREFDLDAALERRPQVLLVDELAHTNAAGVRNKKRFQDIEELLNAGIDVYTTVNVQHIESLNSVIQQITKVIVHETVPDYVFDHAEQVKIIDIEPVELLKRFNEGKVYCSERAEAAMQNFFTLENLHALREIAMRKAAERIGYEKQSSMPFAQQKNNQKIMVCVGASHSSEKCIRWAARMAEALYVPWVTVHVDDIDPDMMSIEWQKRIQENLALAEKLGAEIVTLSDIDIAFAIAEYANISGITNIVVGKSRYKKFLSPAFEDRLIALVPNIEIHIIPDQKDAAAPKKKISRFRSLYLSWQDALKTLLIILLATAISYGLSAVNIGDQNVIMVYILAVLIVSSIL